MAVLDAILDRMGGRRMGVSSAGFASGAVAVGSPASSPSASIWRAQAVARDVAMQIPAMRKAWQVIVAKPATWQLNAYAGDQRLPANDRRAYWLRQPEPMRPLQLTLMHTLDDGLWNRYSLWEIRRDIANNASRFARVHPSRYDVVTEPHDPDTVAAWTIDGQLLDDAVVRRRYLVFDFPMGGLRRFGFQLLELYADLQAAAGNYARAPHPKAILTNMGADLTSTEIDELLESWNNRRATSSVGYLNSAMKYEVTSGWNPKDLQLVESREHAALEVARLVGLPARSLDAESGNSSLTYSTLLDWRRDELEAIRPWTDTIGNTLSMDDRTGSDTGLVLPHGITARLEPPADYLRESAASRMATWRQALAGPQPILSPAEVRAAEPLATETDVPAPIAAGQQPQEDTP